MSGIEMHRVSGDAFRQKGLGSNARRVWRLVHQQPGLTTGQVAGELRIHRTTALTNLKSLRQYGLASSSGNPPTWTGEYRDLDKVSAELGVAGATADLRARHARERAAFDPLVFVRRRANKTNREK